MKASHYLNGALLATLISTTSLTFAQTGAQTGAPPAPIHHSGNPVDASKPASSPSATPQGSQNIHEPPKANARVVPVFVLRDERDRFSSRGARIAMNGAVEGELMPGQYFRIDSEARGSELVADANLSLGQCKLKLDLSNPANDGTYVEVRARLEAVRAESSSKKIGNLIGFAGIGSVVGNVVSVVGGQVSNVTDTSGCTGSFELVEIPKAYAEEKIRRMTEPAKPTEQVDSKTNNNP